MKGIPSARPAISTALVLALAVFLFQGCGPSLSAYRENALDVCEGIGASLERLSDKMESLAAGSNGASLQEKRELASSYAEAQDLALATLKSIEGAGEELEVGVPDVAEDVHSGLVDFLSGLDELVVEVENAMWEGSMTTRVDATMLSSRQRLEETGKGEPREKSLEEIQSIIDYLSGGVDSLESQKPPRETEESARVKQRLLEALRTMEASLESHKAYLETGDGSLEERAAVQAEQASEVLAMAAADARKDFEEARGALEEEIRELDDLATRVGSL